MSLVLDGHRVLVTGAARGIGAAITAACAAAGATVVGCDIADPADDGRAGDWIGADLGRLDELDRVVTQVESSGGCDVLVNNAAIVQLGDPLAATAADVTATLDVNVRAAWYLSTRLAPTVAHGGRGCIVNIGSTHPRTTKVGSFPYNMSKGAVLALTTALAVDLGPRGIRVNSVSPGIVDTEPTKRWIASTPDPAGTRRRLAGDHPLGRLPTPDEVAAAVVFLASDAASAITGIDLVVDAGRNVMRR